MRKDDWFVIGMFTGAFVFIAVFVVYHISGQQPICIGG